MTVPDMTQDEFDTRMGAAMAKAAAQLGIDMSDPQAYHNFYAENFITAYVNPRWFQVAWELYGSSVASGAFGVKADPDVPEDKVAFTVERRPRRWDAMAGMP